MSYLPHFFSRVISYLPHFFFKEISHLPHFFFKEISHLPHFFCKEISYLRHFRMEGNITYPHILAEEIRYFSPWKRVEIRYFYTFPAFGNLVFHAVNGDGEICILHVISSWFMLTFINRLWRVWVGGFKFFSDHISSVDINIFLKIWQYWDVICIHA